MTFKDINESDNNEDSQGKYDRRVDLTKNILKQQEAKKAAKNEDGYSSEIFGMNHRQEMKGGPGRISGTYDPKQEIWAKQESERPRYTVRDTVRETWRDMNTHRPTGTDIYTYTDEETDQVYDPA